MTNVQPQQPPFHLAKTNYGKKEMQDAGQQLLLLKALVDKNYQK